MQARTQGVLPWGSRPRPAPARRKKTGRSQYRRAAWEDFATATLYVADLFGDEPLPADKAKRIELLAARYSIRTPLHRPTDYEPSAYDWVRFLEELGAKMWEEACAARGLRHTVHGMHKAGELYRVRPWDPNRQLHASVKDGYATTPGEAKAKLIAWWKRRGLDISFSPPAWFIDCLGDAQRLQAKQSDAAGGMAWGTKEEPEHESPAPVGPFAEWIGAELAAYQAWRAERLKS